MESKPATFEFSRVLSGFGRERAAIKATFTNKDSQDIIISYLENIGWFMKVYLHTFTVYKSSVGLVQDQSLVQKMIYSPSKDRLLPTMIETQIKIPADSTVVVVFSFDIAFHRFNENPGDAERGLDINPAVCVLPKGKRISSPTLLLPIPIVDDTMPYNVITLTCTVMAIFYGSFFNLLFRRFYLKPKVSQSLIQKLKARLFGK